MPITWSLQRFKVSDLKEYCKNPRKLSKSQYEHLKTSIEKFGLIDKPIATSQGLLIGGHQRKKILQKTGVKEVECYVPDRMLTDKEIEELNIRLNKNTGEWDLDILNKDWDREELLSWGFDNKELELPIVTDFGTDDEFDPELSETPFTVPGDIYDLGGHRLICGSATSLDVIERILDGELIDLVITDPPYNVDYVGKTKEKLKIAGDNMTDSQFELLLKDFYVNAFAFMKPGAPIYVFHADSEGERFRRFFREAGLKLSQCLVWVKNAMVMGRQDYHWQHEPILFGGKDEDIHDPVLYGWKEGKRHNWFSNRKQTTVLKFDRPSRNGEHPTMKPIPLLGYLIANSSFKGNIVFDFFLGSGSTLIASEQLERFCYGTELDPRYCDVIVKRYIKYKKNKGETPKVILNGKEDKRFLKD